MEQKLFQVLIGILKTVHSSITSKYHITVSSPYRYSKNGQTQQQSKHAESVSSPYRYSKNDEYRIFILIHLSVSSPYRYSKNGQEDQIIKHLRPGF